jgi:hypothetical protein
VPTGYVARDFAPVCGDPGVFCREARHVSELASKSLPMEARKGALIPVAAYFDMSGQPQNSRWLVLAGVVAEDSVWAAFSYEWRSILNAHPLKPKYIHMREAVQRIAEFSWRKGWTDAKVQHLVGELLRLLSHTDKKRLKMCFCAIDMDAYRRLKEEGVNLYDSVEICNLNCPEIVLHWYAVKWPGVIDSAHFFFDIGEPFKAPFEDKWSQMKNQLAEPTAQREFWQLIKSVTAVGDKESNPPIQAADVFAYGLHRHFSAEKDKPYRHMADIVLGCIPSIGNVWDEKKLREKCEIK